MPPLMKNQTKRRNMKLAELKTGYVERFIHDRQQQLWDAYLSIDITPLYGWEKPCVELRRCFSRTTHYYGIKDYFRQINTSEVTITETDVTVNESVIRAVIESIIGKNTLVHVKVQEDRLTEVNDLLYKITSEEAADRICCIHWLYSDNRFVLHLMRRLSDWSTYHLRLYDGGDGVIICDRKNELITHYFRLDDELWRRISSIAEKKAAEIAAHPTFVHEDDRCFMNIHLKYGLTWLCPHAYDRFEAGDRYEDTEYPYDETDLPIVRLLMKSNEIQSKWLHMHNTSI